MDFLIQSGFYQSIILLLFQFVGDTEIEFDFWLGSGGPHRYFTAILQQELQYIGFGKINGVLFPVSVSVLFCSR